MSTKLSSVVQWASPFISNLMLLNNSTPEPALSNANTILQTMMGAPLVWEWNRATVDFFCIPGLTEYVKGLTDFGYIESANLTVPYVTSPTIVQTTRALLYGTINTNLNFPKPITAGNVIVVFAFAGTVPSISSTPSNIFHTAYNAFSQVCWYSDLTVSGLTTLSFSLGAGDGASVIAFEISGIKSEVDATADITGSSSLNILTFSNDFIFTFCYGASVGAQISPGIESIFLNSIFSSNQTFLIEGRLATGTGYYISTCTFPVGTTSRSMHSVAFKVVTPTAVTDAGTVYELEVRRKLERTSQPGRPGFISVFNDDMAGNITFKLGSSNPDQAYIGQATYQKASVVMTSINANLPIPDKLVNIFRYGFLALGFLYVNDSRWTEMNQKFIAHLLGYQQGLDEGQKNIFVQNWLQLLADQVGLGPKTNQGYQARGSM